MIRTLSDYVRSIPKEIRKPDESRSWTGLARCLTVAVGFQTLAYFLPSLRAENILWNLPLHAVLIFLTGLSLVSLFVLAHDCGHRSFSKNPLINDTVGFFLFIPLLNSFFTWRAAHDFHHRNSQVRRLDPDWAELLSTPEEFDRLPWFEKLAVRLGPGHATGILVGFWVGMIKRTFFSILIPQMKLGPKKKFKLYAMNLLSAALSVLLIVFYLNSFGVEKLFVIYLLPVLVAASAGALLTFLQHSHPGSYAFNPESYDVVLSQVHSTYNIRYSKFFEYFCLDINIHVPHHILPSIPWYHLKAANTSLKTVFPEDINERSFSYQVLRDSWRSTKLKEVRSGVFKLGG
ncbi:MAG TPA: fatty acid desaturase [Bacteriovoracaceae bacterium]|nr:fatty acid desaturase [Bacteriovoracaceae bacterium]